MSDNTPQELVLVLCRDLLFASKITVAAKAVGTPFKMIRDGSKLKDEPAASSVIVDLTQEGFIEAAAEWKHRTGGNVIGFAGHADVETIAAAQRAGIDQVLTRGEFAAGIETIMASLKRRCC